MKLKHLNNTPKLWLFAALMFLFGQSFGQTKDISGVYNKYIKVTAIPSPCAVMVDSIQEFKVGDQFLLIQMKDGVIDTTNTPSYGGVQDFETAGHFEICEVARISQDTIHLEYQLLLTYNPDEITQAVWFGQEKSLRVVDTVKAQPWDGELGGVVFLNPRDTLILDAPVNVSGMGYQGGDPSDPAVTCGFTDYQTDSYGDGGMKGESFIPYTDFSHGRGCLAIGGGGGNNHNTGGGGGANAGKGGAGGDEYFGGSGSCVPLETGGLGGNPPPYSNSFQRVFMGGGGGGGQQNDAEFVPALKRGVTGTNGGGIIILRSRYMQASATLLNANAAIERDTTGRDGAGGGGAGGSILVEADTLVGNLVCLARGALGKSLNNLNIPGICHGPGGGGGGGLVWMSSEINPAQVSSTVFGGVSGRITNQNSNCFNSPHGATNGLIGLVLNDLSVIEGSKFCPFATGVFDAIDDYYEVEKDSSVFFEMMFNDEYGKQMIPQLTTNPSYGVAALVGDSIDYTPFPNYEGLDTLTYRICLFERPELCDTATVYITVIEAQVVDDEATTYLNTPVNIDVTANDLIGGAGPVDVITQPQNGSYNVVGPLVEYQPFTGFVGVDQFDYRRCNTFKCDTATITVTVIEVDAKNDGGTTEENQPIDIDILENDSYGPTGITKIGFTCLPSNGAISLVDSVIRYLPNVGFDGYDTACYEICIQNYCDTALVIFYVTPEGEGPGEDSVTIRIPNGFSPNGDLINDNFVIEGIEFSTDNELRIFNRYGQEIYGRKNYLNSWNGQNFDGEPLPDGTYFYTLNLFDMDKKYAGYVVIQR